MAAKVEKENLTRDDAVMEELYRVKDEFARRFDYDMARIVHDIRKRQNSPGSPVVSRKRPKG